MKNICTPFSILNKSSPSWGDKTGVTRGVGGAERLVGVREGGAAERLRGAAEESGAEGGRSWTTGVSS